METYKQWIQETFNPVVLVAATPAAEAICTSKNGLTLVDILRPFSHVPRLEAQVRIGDEVIKYTDFRLRFHDVHTLLQPQPEVLETHLHSVLMSAAVKYASLEPRADLLKAVTAGAGLPVSLAELAPWFVEYSSEFMRVTGWGEHQVLDHPVAAILVAPADVPNPVQYFEALLAQVHVPPLMQQEVMTPMRDREFPRYYMLLLDASAPLADERKANENLATLQRTFGPASASLLKINTGTGERVGQGTMPEFFRRFMAHTLPGGGAGEPAARPPPPPQGLGACLSATDLDSVAACVRHFVTQLLLPRLEERVSKLNTAVTAARRGLRNRITRLWKVAADEAASDKPYLWHSMESQLRQLADLAFLLGAYSFANDMYRLAGQDYLAAGNSRWYAGAEEMRALAVVMAPNDNDPQKYFARAYENFGKLHGRPGRLLATRTALMSARFQQAAGRYLAASSMLMRPHVEEESARAAVLLEQSAYCLLFTTPPSMRKFAFHMVLAGLRYNSAGFKRLGLHAYRQVLSVYSGYQWRAIDEHLHDMLGKLCKEVNDWAAVASHSLALLHDPGGPRQTAAAQAHYLHQFHDAMRRTVTKDAPAGQLPRVPSLRLPFMNTKDIRVIFADTSCFGNAAAAACPPTVWTPLEVACSGDVSVIRDTVTAALKQQNREHEEYNLMAAGESVGITVQLRNRLLVKLRATQLRLVCEFTPQDDEQEPMAQPLLPNAPWHQQGQSMSDGSDEGHGAGGGAEHPLAAAGAQPVIHQGKSQYLHQQVLRLTLHPGESVSEVLSVTPLAAGWLRITGVTWLLDDAVEGFQPFEPRGRKRKTPKGPKLSQQKHFPPWRRLLLRVVPAMCRLQLVHDALPTALYTGEVRKVVLRVRNMGTLACRNLHLAVNHPEIACSGSTAYDPGQEPATDAQGGGAACVIRPLKLPVSQQLPGLSVYRPHPSEQELAPGGIQDWTLWLHPRTPGEMQFNMIWYCEPVLPPSAASNTAGAFRFRTLRIAHSLPVSPVVVARPLIGPLPTDLAAQLLRLDLDVPQGVDRVTVAQLTATTRGTAGGWRLSTELARANTPAPPNGTPADNVLLPNLVLAPGEPASLQLILQPPVTAVAASDAQVTDLQPVCNGSQAPARAVLDCSGTLPVGLLDHWYLPGPDGGRSRAASAQALQQGVAAFPSQPTLHADPPIDIAVLWRVGAGGGVGPASGSERVGVLMLPDLTGTSKPPAQPLRSRLRLKDPSTSGAVVHDFRATAMCLVDLVLGVRNCTGRWVQVDVQAGEDASSSAAQHAWSVTMTPPMSGSGSSQQGTPRDSGGGSSTIACQAGLQPGADYMWCGRTRVSVGRLDPGRCVEVPLRVAFFKPGTYVVSGHKLVCSTGGTGPKTTVTSEALMIRVDMA